MPNSSDLGLLVASRYPLVVADESDEARFLSLLCGQAQKLKTRAEDIEALRAWAKERAVPA